MSDLYRFGVSLEQKLCDQFDAHIHEKKYANRSEAIRDLIRESLLKQSWKEGGVVAGAIVMSYDHHKRELVSHLMDIQHDFSEAIISTQHVHLDHHNCLEILAVRGKAERVQGLADMLKAQVGVNHVDLAIAPAGEASGSHHHH